MSKILKNTTVSNISITDTGVVLLASPNTYTIPEQDYLLWAASSNIITQIGSGNVLVNDGSSDLSISEGSDLIKGIFPKELKLIGNTDLTKIGNLTDKLKVVDQDAIIVLNAIAAALGVTTAGIFIENEYQLSTTAETDIPSMTYTVPAGKAFLLTSFMGSYDNPATIHLRLRKQTGGVGAWNQLCRITLEVGGQGQSTIPLNFGNGIKIGVAGDKFKVTGEASVKNKGTIWSCFTGAEV